MKLFHTSPTASSVGTAGEFLPPPRREGTYPGPVRTRVSFVVGLLACALITGAPATAAASADGDGRRDLDPRDTSGNEPGWIAAPRTARAATPWRTNTRDFRLAPGLRYTRWTQVDARGPIRAHLLTINPRTPGLRIDYASGSAVRRVATVPDILAVDRAVAGVNGDFYDIGVTGAPLGVGVDRQRGLLHGRAGTSAAFYLDRQGRPTIGELPLVMRVRDHPEITLTALNSPYVLPDSVGFYNRAWGRTAGYRMTDGDRKGLRVVWLIDGKVVRVTRTLTNNRPMKGGILIGRGLGAQQLRALQPGMHVRIARGIPGGPRMVITGSQLLLHEGAVRATDDRIMHPRTAVGINHRTGQVLLLVIEGRSRASRGYTTVELADLMLDLGADEALNLDGGGSSTMVVGGRAGRPHVVNRPGDGFLRRVSNAVEVTYRAPRKR
jgi:hypothetical protein